MTPGSRHLALALLALFLAWQAAVGAADIFHEVASATMDDRRFALRATEPERVRRAVAPWADLHRAIEEHVPWNGIVGVAFQVDPASFETFYRLSVLAYPRRVIPITQLLSEDERARVASTVATFGKPIFVLDVASGFPMPPAATPVARGAGFTLSALSR